MAQPHSPLLPSDGNGRSRSSCSPPATARRRGIDEVMGTDYEKENVFANPSKRLFYDGAADEEEPSPKRLSVMDAERVNESDDIEPPPSSPFQYDVRDDTVDAAKLQEMHMPDAMESSPTKSLADIPPSSPFQYDVKDDTVDAQRLQDLASPSRNSSRSHTPQMHHGGIYVDEDARAEFEEKENKTTTEATAETSIDTEQAPSSRSERTPNTSVIHDNHSSRLDVGASIIEERRHEEMSTVEGASAPDSAKPDDVPHSTHPVDVDSMDDTRLSTFSMLPDMTTFANLRRSPAKNSAEVTNTPTKAWRGESDNPLTPTTARRSSNVNVSPTPRRRQSNESVNLLDLADSVNYFHRVSQRFSRGNNRLSPRKSSPFKSRRESMRSPGKYNLIDFDIPPAPTPRSIPTITPRELESLKSGYLSEISSLRATLSGKEAEVSSLKQAVADAERRVAEALEEVRNEAIRKEALEVEQAEWQRRGREMETVLREVRAEIIETERERDRLAAKLEEAEKQREQLESRIVELESQLDAARKMSPQKPSPPSSDQRRITPEECAREVQDAVEKVARELHSLYKSKHENKVAALKKSYEARWEKRVREAENRFKEAQEEIERLKTERPFNPSASMLARDTEALETENRMLEAKLKGLEQEMASVKKDNERLHEELRVERAEKSELVAAVDEWLAMQQQILPDQPQPQPQTQPQPPQHAEQRSALISSRGSSVSSHSTSGMPMGDESAASTTTESTNSRHTTDADAGVKRSGSRGSHGHGHSSSASGIRPPSSGKSRLSFYGHSRNNSGGGRPSNIGSGIPTPGRSGIMSSIERMGRGGS